MLKKNYFIICGLLLVSFFSVFGQKTEVKKCSVPKGIDGKYKLISEVYTYGEAKHLLIEVAIKPKNFNRKYMIEFVKRIRAIYCNENSIYLSIFDNKKDQLGAVHDLFMSNGKVDRRRGSYSFEKKTNEEILEFSLKKGNPRNEVKIDFNQPIENGDSARNLKSDCGN